MSNALSPRARLLLASTLFFAGALAATVSLGACVGSEPQAYYPIYEIPLATVSLVARGKLPASELLAAVQGAVRAADPTQAVYNVRTLDEMYSLALAPRRSNTVLITVFGALGLVLAIVGVYGVVAYSVSLRSRELGIRSEERRVGKECRS